MEERRLWRVDERIAEMEVEDPDEETARMTARVDVSIVSPKHNDIWICRLEVKRR